MIATLLVTLFAGSALLALAAIKTSVRRYGRSFLALRAQLRADHAVSVRYSWREHAAPSETATIYRLNFKPKAECLPFQPELSAAA